MSSSIYESNYMFEQNSTEKKQIKSNLFQRLFFQIT